MAERKIPMSYIEELELKYTSCKAHNVTTAYRAAFTEACAEVDRLRATLQDVERSASEAMDGFPDDAPEEVEHLGILAKQALSAPAPAVDEGAERERMKVGHS